MLASLALQTSLPKVLFGDRQASVEVPKLSLKRPCSESNHRVMIAAHSPGPLQGKPQTPTPHPRQVSSSHLLTFAPQPPAGGRWMGRKGNHEGNGTAIQQAPLPLRNWTPVVNFEVQAGVTPLFARPSLACPGGGSRYSHRLSPSRVTITTPSKLGAQCLDGRLRRARKKQKESPMRTA